ncbi:conserved Plasmodium protein, unknown function [Plasmodium ovale]|uniref:Uncharacterized protein n=1 Tax=Plasmodium ovale TaxID=36330 RepID=A0A1D3KYR7_PLAOA|nr:conserved Plasmodium protein, unknown function [Plasmodium ovale]
MIEFDEIFEFMKEVEMTCENFNERKEGKEKIILFIYELKTYINDISDSLREKLNQPNEEIEFHILKKIINKKEKLENAIAEKEWYSLMKTTGEGVPNNISHDNVLHCIHGTQCVKCARSDTTKDEYPSINGKWYTESDETNYRKRSHACDKKGEYWGYKTEDGSSNSGVHFVDDLPQGDNVKGPTLIENSVKDYAEKNDHEGNKKWGMDSAPCNLQVESGEETSREKKINLAENIELLKDDVIKEWSEQIDEYDNLIYEFTFAYKKEGIRKKIEKRKSLNSFDGDIDEELCLLAQEMKENVLTYRQIITDDNKALEESANKQLHNIDSLTDVNIRTKKMNTGANISFFLSLIIIAISALLFMFTFFIILIL